MISYLKGTIIDKDEKTVTLLTNSGVGYLIFIPKHLLPTAEIGKETVLYIYTHIREDEISLFGFEKNEERSFFKLLISVNGIGPKIGLEILSVPLATVISAIINEDHSTLTTIPGLGKKTAERIILELKQKIEQFEQFHYIDQVKHTPHINEEIIHALIGLGYARRDIIEVLKNFKPETNKPEEAVRYFLQNV